MPSVMDRRVQKTCRLLQDALIGLISEKGFEAVTIQEILDRANVGRSTFYTHFENKHELLHSCFEDFHHLFEKHQTFLSEDQRYFRDLNDTGFILDILRFTARNHHLFKALLGKEGAMFNHPVHEYIFTFTVEALKKLARNKRLNSLQLEMSANYMASAFIGALKWWVENDMPLTAEEMDKYLKLFAMKGVGDALG